MVPHEDLTGTYNFGVTVLGDGLRGDVESDNTSSAIQMSSNTSGLWTITYANTDNNDSPCGTSQRVTACTGQTGRWLLTSAPTPPTNGVPEPASALLLIAGMTMLYSRRRA
jgi:hypothetical protein